MRTPFTVYDREKIEAPERTDPSEKGPSNLSATFPPTMLDSRSVSVRRRLTGYNHQSLQSVCLRSPVRPQAMRRFGPTQWPLAPRRSWIRLYRNYCIVIKSAVLDPLSLGARVRLDEPKLSSPVTSGGWIRSIVAPMVRYECSTWTYARRAVLRTGISA